MEPLNAEPSPRDLRYSIDISDTQAFLVVDAEAITGLVRRLLEREGIGRASISLALVDNATIEALNRRHLGHAGPTDVLSFPLTEPGDGVLAGELVVSAEMAAATGREAGVNPEAELALYLVHGLLHLCGYDDHAPADVERIRRREAEIMAAEGLTYTYPLDAPAERGNTEREPVRWSG